VGVAVLAGTVLVGVGDATPDVGVGAQPLGKWTGSRMSK
jgi:hypothetical protein